MKRKSTKSNKSNSNWCSSGNSGTRVQIDSDWVVLDIGSGHNPHPRANILMDKYLFDDTERSGQKIVLPSSKHIVVGDAVSMPFKDKAIDFIVCSHVAEHIDNVDSFCKESNRVGLRGYIETPSRFAETIRHPPNHRWIIEKKNKTLTFSPIAQDYPLGYMGKLFFSFYFYKNIQAENRNICSFARGVRKPFHYFFWFIRWSLVRAWLLLKPLTYTRFLWENNFSWKVFNNGAE